MHAEVIVLSSSFSKLQTPELPTPHHKQVLAGVSLRRRAGLNLGQIVNLFLSEAHKGNWERTSLRVRVCAYVCVRQCVFVCLFVCLALLRFLADAGRCLSMASHSILSTASVLLGCLMQEGETLGGFGAL